jgi:hypothetical protein
MLLYDRQVPCIQCCLLRVAFVKEYGFCVVDSKGRCACMHAGVHCRLVGTMRRYVDVWFGFANQLQSACRIALLCMGSGLDVNKHVVHPRSQSALYTVCSFTKHGATFICCMQVARAASQQFNDNECEEACGVCLEEDGIVMLTVMPCKHALCGKNNTPSSGVL